MATAMVPSAASAKIVIGEGAGGVAIGDTGTHVKQALGKPARVQGSSGGESWLYKSYWITLSHKRVRGVETRDPQQKTGKGIGPGSTLPQLRHAYPAISCKSSSVADRVCHLSTRSGKKKIPTNFVFFDGKIEIVDIGEVGQIA